MTSRGLFCVSSVDTYPAGVPDLDGVADEIRIMRRALGSLGLTELFPDADLDHDQLARRLELWSDQDAGTEPDGDTLVIYCTGHGTGSARYGLKLGDGTTFGTERFVAALENRTSLEQVVLIVDACFSQGGAWAANREVHMPGTETARLDFWGIAASRRLETASQRIVARAFADAVARAASPSWTEEFLDPGAIAAAIDSRLPATQNTWLAAGHSAKPCRALPNPRHQRPIRPTGLPLDVEWAASARGLRSSSAPGFFFTGRTDELRRLRAVDAGDPPVTVVSGGPGSGKTALLGHLVLTSTAGGNAAMPTSAREAVPLPPLTVLAGRGNLTTVLRSLDRGLGGIAGVDAGRIVRALQARPGPVLVVLDLLEEADPELWEPFLADLGRTPGVRLVIALPPDTRIRLAVPRSVVNLDSCVNTAQDVRGYLRLRVTLASPAAQEREIDAVTDHLAEVCQDRFDVAVEVADRHAEVGAGLPHDTEDWATDVAAEAAMRTGRRLLKSVMASRAAVVVDAIAALCSYDPSIGLPTADWAAAASDPDLGEVSAADVARAAARLTPFVREWRAADGTPRWRWTFGHPSIRASSRARYLARLPQLAAGPPDTEAVDPATLKLLARAAAVTTARGRWIDDPRFLLDAPPTLVQAAVRSLPGDRREQARLSRLLRPAWLSGTSADDRTFLLGIDARRHGVAQIADALSTPGTAPGPRLVWCQPGRPFGSEIVKLVVAPGPPAVAVTVHEDGEVAFWSVASGAPLRSPVDRVPGGVKHVAVETVDGSAIAILSTGRHEVWSVPCEGTAPPDRTHRLDWPATSQPAPPVALHPAGMLVIGHGEDVLIAGRHTSTPRRLARMDTEVLHVRAAGPLDAPVAWAFGASGRIRRLRLDDGARRDPVIFPIPGRPSKAAVSRDGERALIVDTSGVVHLLSVAGGNGVLPGARPFTVRAVAIAGDRCAVAGGSSGELGWIDLVGTGDPAPSPRIPLDDPGIGVEFVGEDVLVARPSGLLLIAPPRGLPTSTEDR